MVEKMIEPVAEIWLLPSMKCKCVPAIDPEAV